MVGSTVGSAVAMNVVGFAVQCTAIVFADNRYFRSPDPRKMQPDGSAVGSMVGSAVGFEVGEKEGAAVGYSVGSMVGSTVHSV